MKTRLSLAGLLIASLVLLFVFVALGSLGRLFWVFDLMSHFRVQYAASALVLTIFFLLLGHRRCALISIILSFGLACTFLPITASSAKKTGDLKLVSFNVLTSNTGHEGVVRFLEAENADVVFLMEVDDQWVEDLQPLRNIYPFELSFSREDNFGVVLFSKFPFSRQEIVEFSPYAIPAVDVTIEKEVHRYRLYGLHTFPPSSGENANFRNEQLYEAASLLASDASAHHILMGDLNLTHFSPCFKEVLRKGNLKDTSQGAGVSPTWMRKVPLFAIAIDHVLISHGLELIKRRVGPSLGSDHNPLIVEICPR